MPDASAPSVEETLAWEAEHRPVAGTLALVAGNLTLFGGIAASLAFQDFPHVSTLDGIRDAAGLPLTVGTGLRTQQLAFYDHHFTSLMAVAIVLAIGSAAMAGVLGYLFRATAARTQNLPRIALYGAVGGPIMVAVSEIALQVATSVKAHDFVTGSDHSTAAAHDAFGGGVILATQVLRQAGLLMLAFSFVLIGLNAMRAGLLTRFMGVLGMIVGGLFIIPLGSNLPIVQSFWLIAVGVLIFGRWPGGVPPAWRTGRAEPWPTQQQLREQREGLAAPAAAPAGGGAGTATAREPAARPAASAHPSSKKRKTRKRR